MRPLCDQVFFDLGQTSEHPGVDVEHWEDNQDPETSYRWQRGNAEKFVAEDSIVEDYFDVGQSRSVPWHRRPEAARLLADLKSHTRGWSAIVVGEGTRCWFGNQFSLVAPRIQAHKVEVWVPELGGRVDPRNVTHSIMMSMLGGLSESERQRVQQRTGASMDAQVLNEGRHQGGRAPYGYMVVDGPPHPNPNRASDGSRLRILSLDVATAPVVQRIFRDYIAGRGDKAIAHELNREGIPCPSAHRPEQNRHRSQDGWQASTVSAILQNPRYTGYAIFGRWNKHEELLDPDDVAAGHITRLRRSPNHRIIRSKKPAHPAIVTVETFTQAQLVRRQRAGTGIGARGRLERTRRPSPREYLLRGLLRCDACGRKMQPEAVSGIVYYRCRAPKPWSPPAPSWPSTHPRSTCARTTSSHRSTAGWPPCSIGPIATTPSPACSRPKTPTTTTHTAHCCDAVSPTPKPNSNATSPPSKQESTPRSSSPR
ncbi:recombinase family protein [Nocardia amikacinitolerans]|uniref:recombinase family protein n=1 Tax=Nocardia amikacinitolerans TaxID=756689 RepID=UPI0015CED050|nr:recombinase family protein [Nocardia amikacinitolerans]